MKQRLFAFWSYGGGFGVVRGLLLGGHVTQMRDDGRVETEEYGKGHWFMPCRIVPAHVGEKLLAAFREIEKGHRAALEALQEEWAKKMAEAIPWQT